MAPESLRILKFAVNRRTLAAPYNNLKGVCYDEDKIRYDRDRKMTQLGERFSREP